MLVSCILATIPDVIFLAFYEIFLAIALKTQRHKNGEKLAHKSR